MPLRNVRAQCNLLYNLSITRSIDNFHGYLIRSHIRLHIYENSTFLVSLGSRKFPAIVSIEISI